MPFTGAGVFLKVAATTNIGFVDEAGVLELGVWSETNSEHERIAVPLRQGLRRLVKGALPLLFGKFQIHRSVTRLGDELQKINFCLYRLELGIVTMNRDLAVLDNNHFDVAALNRNEFTAVRCFRFSGIGMGSN